jgi:hypothetical protein
MKKRSIYLLSILFIGTGGGLTQAQEQSQSQAPAQEQPKPAPKKEIEELRLKLNEDGSHYIKATFLNQIWFRGNQSNPGTQVLSVPTANTFDIGLRRTRFQLYGTLTDHVQFYFQLGQNNFNFQAQNGGNRKMQFFVHDALGEYRVKKGSDILYLGGGLTITNGLSRFSQPSIGTIMTMDVPVFAQATVDQTDEFSRKLSMYARGQLGHLDYRLIMSDPFPINTNGSSSLGGAIPVNPLTNVTYPTSTNAAFAQAGHHKQYQGFFMWNFFDKESHVTPYMTGTYLGKKKVLNLEGGFITQKNALWSYNGEVPTVAGPANTTYHNMNLWSVAVFYDTPLNTEKGTALNAYLGYFHTDYGKGYLRYNGIMNPATNNSDPGLTTLGSYGNAFPMFGTGNVIYGQFGYLLRQDLFGEGNGTLMPYVTVQSAKYSDRINGQMTVYNAGCNWFIKGHTSKFTLDFQERPTYSFGANNVLTRNNGMKGQAVLQYQYFF